MRHPHDIVPRDDKDDFLVAIYDELCAIRSLLERDADGPVRDSAEPAVVTEPEPSPPAAAPQKTPAKKTATRKRKTTARKKA